MEVVNVNVNVNVWLQLLGNRAQMNVSLIGILADCPAMPFVFVCRQIKIKIQIKNKNPNANKLR